jgi:hypothetical protein
MVAKKIGMKQFDEKFVPNYIQVKFLCTIDNLLIAAVRAWSVK